MRYSRNRALGVLAASVLLTLGACSSDTRTGNDDGADQSSDEVQRVRVALSAFQDVSSVYVGIEQGFFDELNIDLDIQNTDWPSANELLIGGHTDLANACESDVMVQNGQGNDTTLAFPLFYFAGGGLVYDPEKHPDWLSFEESLAEHSGDREAALRATLEQVEGAKIGLSKVSGEYATLLGLLETAGLDVEDFDVLDIVQEDLPPTLFSGSIDIMISGIPQRLAAVNQGYETLLDQSAVPATIAHCGFAASRDWLDANMETAARVEAGILRSLAFVEEEPATAFPIIASRLKSAGTEISVEELQSVWNVMEFFPSGAGWYDENVANPSGDFYWKSRFESVYAQLQAGGSLSGDLDVSLEDLNYGLKIVPASAEFGG